MKGAGDPMTDIDKALHALDMIYADVTVTPGMQVYFNCVRDTILNLTHVDEILARRSALDDLPTRVEKIEKCIGAAMKADVLEARISALELELAAFQHDHEDDVKEIARMKKACSEQEYSIRTILAEALGYSEIDDLPTSGEHTAETLAREAAKELAQLRDIIIDWTGKLINKQMISEIKILHQDRAMMKLADSIQYLSCPVRCIGHDMNTYQEEERHCVTARITWAMKEAEE
jgi:hypothetical protein